MEKPKADSSGLISLKMGIETRDKAYNRLIDSLAEIAAYSTDTILLQGDAGTGKTLLARRIYDYKKSLGLVTGPLVEVNCGLLEEKEMASVLFGSASQTAPEAALARASSGGMLFLDQVDRLPPEAQRQFLYAVESGHYRPLGAAQEESCEFLLVSAVAGEKLKYDTHYDEEFLSRIGLWSFTLPSLVERPQDIAPNLEYELARYREKNGRPCGFDPIALKAYLAFAYSPKASWSGNFRSLNQSVRRMAFAAGGGFISLEVVEEEIDRLRALWDNADSGTFRASVETDCPGPDEDEEEEEPAPIGEMSSTAAKALEECDEFDRAQLLAVLEVCQTSESMAAAGRKLFAKSRTRRASVNDSDRLKKYLARFGLDWDTVKG